jgi:hypothetical protein
MSLMIFGMNIICKGYAKSTWIYYIPMECRGKGRQSKCSYKVHNILECEVRERLLLFAVNEDFLRPFSNGAITQEP